MTLMHPTAAPEWKSAEAPPTPEEVVAAFDEFMRSFESFKQANDQRIAEIENRVGGTDPLTGDKIDRINQALDEQKHRLDRLIHKSVRPPLGGRRGGIGATEHKAAFETYVRRGVDLGLARLEEKAMSIGSDPDGGYLVPDETEREIGRRLAQVSPIRGIASVRQVTASVYKKPFSVTGPAVGWVGETAARPETSAPTLAELQFPAMELYAMPAATASLLDDSAVNIDEWIAMEVETAFAEQEGAAFVAGDGVAKPRGFLDYTAVDESTWSWGNLGYVATGADGALPATDGSDVLVDLVYALKAGYRQNAHWVMSRRSQAEIRKLKDADGNYLWQPPASAGAAATLMNFPVAESEDMPDITSGSLSVAFGDFQRGYLVVDRLGVRVLRDPYSAKPYVLFYITKRVGGGVQDFDAIKLLKFAAS